MAKDPNRILVPPHLDEEGRLATVQFRAMGTTVEIGLVSEGYPWVVIEECLREAVNRCFKDEQRFSRFLPESEVSFVNQHAGQWLEISSDLAEILEVGLTSFHRTGGLVSPGLGAQMKALGYNQSFEFLAQTGQVGGASQTEATETGCEDGKPPYELRKIGGVHTVRLRPKREIDLGGIGKGWIAERGAAWVLSQGFTQFVYNAGGDLVCRGKNGDRPWRIGINDPFHESQSIRVLELHSMAMATSGTYRRQWRFGEQIQHHLINPRTGKPADTDIVSCTIVNRGLVDAEVFAKAALIMGHKDGTQWLKANRVPGWVMITKDGQVFDSWNSSMNGL